ncbi:DUF1441 family protein [Campylobacter concisus]|jgi:hypothetical protein|uniref:DUF1441 family protein n=1 Tax=Campylobacter concisus TaxID=199 RepID=UPI000CD85A89|nr:DUF1441 family protein [Campylobacter concisus]DAR26802.1 MAG TPA: DNA packaging protein [Caudoviricetes sp.]DAX94931.1 MAG TPA: DNA packaging protein [Caudoviricetes sp.]
MQVSTKELSNALGLTDRRVQELESEGVIKKLERNKWDLTACIDAYLDYKIKLATQSFELSEARAKKELADAELKELRLAKEKGEVIAIDRLEKDLSDIAAAVSNKLYSLPNKLKRSINLSDEVENAINNEVENILTELKDAKIYKDFA